METRSQVAIRKDFYAHVSGKFPKEISEEKGPNLHDCNDFGFGVDFLF